MRKEVYTTGDVARLCHVQKITVIRWVERGELPAHQLPGRGDRRITHRDLVAFMQANEFPTPDDFFESQTDILVIDDKPQSAQTMRRALTSVNYRVEIAKDGFHAGTMIERLKPRLVTLDVSMPGITDSDIVQYIHHHHHLDATKVIVIRAESGEDSCGSLSGEADRILTKPFSNADLIATVQEALAS